jgi:hypothetical protein
VRDERTTERCSVDGCLLGACEFIRVGPAMQESLLAAELRDRDLEVVVLVWAERGPRLPDIGGRSAVQAARVRRGVGLQQRLGDVRAGPLPGMTRTHAVLLRPSFQRTDAGFDGAIVRRVAWR